MLTKNGRDRLLAMLGPNCAMLLVLAFAYCSIGCATMPRLTPQEQAAVTAADRGWVEAGLPKCSAVGRPVMVVYAPAPCGNPNTADCVQMRGRWQALVIRDDLPIVDELGGPLVHGRDHILQRACLDEVDAAHQNGRVWIESGGADSAQGRARDILLGPAPPLTETLK